MQPSISNHLASISAGSCEGPANRLEAKEGESEGEAKSKGL
jgi:hypothetical protein